MRALGQIYKRQTRLNPAPRPCEGKTPHQNWAGSSGVAEIRELLDAGHSLKDVCRWLNEIGLQIGYARLSDYVTQLRRRDEELPKPSGSGPKDDVAAAKQEVEPPIQPLAHLVEREKKRTGFSFNEEPDPKKLI